MRMHFAVLVALLALVALTAACGGGDDPGGSSTEPLSVEQALADSGNGPATVSGFLVAPDGEPVRLCSALLESYPPQCGEPSLVVEGLDLTTVAGLTSTNDPSLAQVTWSDTAISVPGELSSGVLTAVP
jgi:hypothetical protein